MTQMTQMKKGTPWPLLVAGLMSVATLAHTFGCSACNT